MIIVYVECVGSYVCSRVTDEDSYQNDLNGTELNCFTFNVHTVKVYVVVMLNQMYFGLLIVYSLVYV